MKCRVFDPLNDLLAGATGIMGGSFDPVQSAHIEKALAARRVLKLDEVIFVPAATSPYKPDGPVASNEDRLAMLRLITDRIGGLSVSNVELKREGVSYTLPTMRLFGAPERDLVMIVGTDAFLTIKTWHKWRELLKLVHVVVIPRPGSVLKDPNDVIPGLKWQEEIRSDAGRSWVSDDKRYLVWLDLPMSDVSSTEVRRLIAAGESYAYFVPPGVDAYVEQHGLYRQKDDADGQ